MISCLNCLILGLFPLSPLTQSESPNKQGRPVDAKIGDNRQMSLPIIRQAWLDTQTLPSGLGSGSWSIISKRLFDGTYQRSQQIMGATQNPPWLTQARYKAVYRDGQLQGIADLTLYNPHDIPAVAKLNPWNLPLIQNNKLAGASLVFRHSERSLGLSVAAKSTVSQELPWSLAGDQRSDGVWFHFQLPACPLATIDIILPSDEELDCPSAPPVVAGPFPVDDSASRRWQLQFGFSVVHDFQVAVRRSPLSSQGKAALRQGPTQAHLNAEFVAGSAICRARYDFDIHQPYGQLSTLTFELPDGFQLERAGLRQGDQEQPLEWKRMRPDESTENSNVLFSRLLFFSLPHFSFNPFFILSAAEARSVSEGGLPSRTGLLKDTRSRDGRTVQITFPNSVKQRATLVLSGNFELSTTKRFSFSFPRPRGVWLLSPLLRIASQPSRSWQDFVWGDFEPLQTSAERQQTLSRTAGDFSNEILMSVHEIPTNSHLRIPSARLSETVAEDVVAQDSYWHLDGVRSWLAVKCRCKIWPKDNLLSWRVPRGWGVRDVLGLSGCEIYSWTCQKDLLLIEPRVPAQPGQTIALLIKLRPEAIVNQNAVSSRAPGEDQLLRFPHLLTVSTTERAPVMSGSYALSLGRRGQLFPDGVRILSSPGTPSFPDNTWQELSHLMGDKVPATPDGFWVFSGNSPAGELSLSIWPPDLFVRSAATVFRKIENGPEWRIRFHLTIDPLAGAVQEIPLHFSQSISADHLILTNQNLQHVPSATFSLEAGSVLKGGIHFSQPILDRQELDLELVCHPEESVPLLIPDCNFEATLAPARPWQVVNPNQFGLYEQSEARNANYLHEAKSFRYTAQSRSPIFEQVVPADFALAKWQAHVGPNVVEYDYRAWLAPHSSPITLTLPSGTQLLDAEHFASPQAKRLDHNKIQLNDESDGDEAGLQRYELTPISVEPQISFRFPPSSEEVRCRLVYRTKIAGYLGVYQVIIADPTWELLARGQTSQKRYVWSDRTWSILDFLQTPCWFFIGDSFLVIDSGLVHFVGLCGTILLILLAHKFSIKIIYLLAGLVLTGALILPPSLFLVTIWLIFGLIMSRFFCFTKKNKTLQAESASAKKMSALLIFCFASCLLVFLSNHLLASPQTGAQEQTALVYFLPGNPNDEEHARAAIPAALWSRLQLAANQSLAGFSERYCIESITTQANVVENHLSLTTEWALFTTGTEPLPLVIPHVMTNGKVPREMSLDGQPFQLSLLPGSGGASVGELRSSGAGRHRLRMTWQAPIIASAGMRSVELYFPGAPVQELTVTFPDRHQHIFLTGSEGSRTIVHNAEKTQFSGNVGMSRKAMLSWPESTSERVDAQVELGVLWEHRIDQSIAHAVIDYRIQRGAIQELPVSLPSGCHIRKIELIRGTENDNETDTNQVTASSPTQQELRIKSWRIDGDQKSQRLTVELQRPFSRAFHLLLELGFDRHPSPEGNKNRQPESAGVTVPLSVPWPIDVTSCRGFVAYLFDGVKGDLTQALPRAPAGSVDFARPWLPALGSLPAEQILALPRDGYSSSAIDLHSLSRDYSVAGTCEMSLGEREIVSTLNLQLQSKETPLLYLSAELPEGHHLAEVQGQRLARWQIMPSVSGQTEKLEIWLRVPLPVGEATELRLLSRMPISLQPHATMTVPIFQAHWNTTCQEPTTWILKSAGRVGLDNLELSPGINKVFGPWQDPAIVNQCLLDVATLKKSITFQPRLMTRLPSTQAEMIETASGSQWRLKLQASEDQSLPPWLEIISTTEESLSRMVFQADVPIASRPFVGLDRKLHWSIHALAPWRRLTITKSLVPDESGHFTLPVLVFPQFPQVKYQQPVSK